MIRTLAIVLTALTLSACVTERETLVEYMTRTDVDLMIARLDATNARIQCRALARTLVQITRCDVR